MASRKKEKKQGLDAAPKSKLTWQLADLVEDRVYIPFTKMPFCYTITTWTGILGAYGVAFSIVILQLFFFCSESNGCVQCGIVPKSPVEDGHTVNECSPVAEPKLNIRGGCLNLALENDYARVEDIVIHSQDLLFNEDYEDTVWINEELLALRNSLRQHSEIWSAFSSNEFNQILDPAEDLVEQFLESYLMGPQASSDLVTRGWMILNSFITNMCAVNSAIYELDHVDFFTLQSVNMYDLIEETGEINHYTAYIEDFDSDIQDVLLEYVPEKFYPWIELNFCPCAVVCPGAWSVPAAASTTLYNVNKLYIHPFYVQPNPEQDISPFNQFGPEDDPWSYFTMEKQLTYETVRKNEDSSLLVHCEASSVHTSSQSVESAFEVCCQEMTLTAKFSEAHAFASLLLAVTIIFFSVALKPAAAKYEVPEDLAEKEDEDVDAEP